MSKAPTLSAVVMMSEKRAREITKQFLDHMAMDGPLILQLRDQEGWRAMGYASFTAYCDGELEGSRSQIYRLMHQAEVTANVSQSGTRLSAPVPLTHAAVLAQLPAAEQAPALKEASKAAGGTPTVEHVAAAVEKRKDPAPKKAAATVTKANPKYAGALERIGKICGKPIVKNIENGILKQITVKEAIAWAALPDDQMADIQELVVTKRWLPTKAHKFRNRMVGPNTKIEELISHCVAEGGEWNGSVNGYGITVTERRRR